MLNFGLRVISVTFFDETTRKIISSSRMPLDRLPATFAVNTDLKMNGSEYIVVSATPETKVEFARAKELKVFLRKR